LGDGLAPGLRLGQVQPGLGSHRPTRDEHCPVGTDHSEGVDDAQVHPGDAIGIGGEVFPVAFDLHLGGDIDTQPGPVRKQVTERMASAG